MDPIINQLFTLSDLFKQYYMPLGLEIINTHYESVFYSLLGGQTVISIHMLSIINVIHDQ